MTSRRDQLLSYQFLVRRTVSALVMREADPAVSPLRRGVGAVFAGVMIAVLAASGFGVYGLLTKGGGTDIRVEGTVVVERDTGAGYVFLGGRLHPALNYASALLAAGKAPPTVAVVGSSTLAGIPRGATVGIPGAPASLPKAGQAVGMPWTQCSVADGTGTAARRSLTLAVGTTSSGVGSGISRLGDGQALLVADEDGRQEFLLWHGHRYAIREPQIVVPALYGALAAPTPVDGAWLNPLPAGADIGPVSVPDRGSASQAAVGRRVGDLLVAATGSGPQYYLVRADGVEPIGVLQKEILLSQTPEQPIPVSLADVTGLPQAGGTSARAGDTAAPAVPPTLVTPGSTDPICAVFSDARSAPALRVGGAPAGLEDALPTATGQAAGGTGLAAHVLIPPGHVAVVRALPSPEAQSGAYFVVTELGIRYSVPAEDLKLLGYDVARAVDVPAALLTLIPSGPALDPAAAAQPAQLTSEAGS